jgi:hypothetical protein
MSIGYIEKNFTAEEVSAIRVSVALLKSDMMRKAINTGIGDPRAVNTVKDGQLKDNKFIKDVNELKEWLSKDVIWKKPREMKWVNAVKTIDGKSGVLIIQSDTNYTFNPKTHATLWNGDKNDIVECGSHGMRQFMDSDKVYFWELAKTGADLNAKKSEVYVVIDRYKMPGLNEDGTDIADDMCYGVWSSEIASRPIHKKDDVETYIEEYQKKGFDKKEHMVFSNKNGIDSKRIYDIHDVSNVFNIEETLKKSDDVLFIEFREMVINYFTVARVPSMQANILQMIQKFQNKEGGIYENMELRNYIKDHPSTHRYCDELTKYIKKKLRDNGGDVSKLEDTDVYWKRKDESGKYSLDATKWYRESKGKTFYLTPRYNTTFSLGGEGQRNMIEGVAIAVGDVWATEAVITRYESDKRKKEYTVGYKVTLWDHFGLNIEDLVEKLPRLFDGFKAWFILQHFRGYKPFITKIEFDKEFKGNYK